MLVGELTVKEGIDQLTVDELTVDELSLDEWSCYSFLQRFGIESLVDCS